MPLLLHTYGGLTPDIVWNTDYTTIDRLIEWALQANAMPET